MWHFTICYGVLHCGDVISRYISITVDVVFVCTVLSQVLNFKWKFFQCSCFQAMLLNLITFFDLLSYLIAFIVCIFFIFVFELCFHKEISGTHYGAGVHHAFL